MEHTPRPARLPLTLALLAGLAALLALALCGKAPLHARLRTPPSGNATGGGLRAGLRCTNGQAALIAIMRHRNGSHPGDRPRRRKRVPVKNTLAEGMRSGLLCPRPFLTPQWYALSVWGTDGAGHSPSLACPAIAPGSPPPIPLLEHSGRAERGGP